MQLLLRPPPPHKFQLIMTRGCFVAWARMQHDVFIDAI
jgi:hypothetical protein